MTDTQPRTAAAKLLDAARRIPGSFTLTRLVLVAWEFYPDTFGLEGCPEHPSDNKVRTLLYGAKGLLRRGLIVSEGKRFRVADSALNVAHDLLKGESE